MDTLIAAGTLSAYLYSLAALAAGSLHLYFDTAAALVTLTLLGRAVEERLRESVTRENADLLEWTGRKARLLSGGREQWVAAVSLGTGDEVLVRPGERVAVDSRILSGRARLDESTLTGEARPVRREPGEEIPGGALVLEGELRVQTLRRAGESAAGRMIALMQEALEHKLPSEVLADRLTRRLVPAILCLAVAAAVCLRLGGASTEEAVLRALTVLVITCPCALGIAIPLAKVAAVRAGRARGILVRDPAALERVPTLDTVVFDKTGTLTEGNYALREVVVEGATSEEALRRAASLEQRSSHLLAREVLRRAEDDLLALEPPADVQEVDGLGVWGFVSGEVSAVGNRRLMESRRFTLPEGLERRQTECESMGLTTAFVGWGGRVRGLLAFGDALKPGAAACVAALRSRGLSPWLISGDSAGATARAAQGLGIDRFVGGALPADKALLVRELRSKGHRVAMVGDGLNDAAALAEADVGFVLGAGPEFLCQAANFIILARDPGRLAEALDLGTLAARVMRQNLFFAFFYNALAVPLALSGLLNPMLAALAMFASSLAVVGNTLRVSRLARAR
jgi:heavy metal translocating P-type ATPase